LFKVVNIHGTRVFNVIYKVNGKGKDVPVLIEVRHEDVTRI